MNSLGILSGGGSSGALLAEWIIQGSPTRDVSAINIARSMPHESTRVFLGARIPTMLGLHLQLRACTPILSLPALAQFPP